MAISLLAPIYKNGHNHLKVTAPFGYCFFSQTRPSRVYKEARIGTFVLGHGNLCCYFSVAAANNNTATATAAISVIEDNLPFLFSLM